MQLDRCVAMDRVIDLFDSVCLSVTNVGVPRNVVSFLKRVSVLGG